MSTGQLFRNFTYEFETLKWWLYMRSTAIGPSILGRGVWKFAMACVHDYDEVGFHVVEKGDAWAIVPAYEVDIRSLPADYKDAAAANLRWRSVIDWLAGPCRTAGPGRAPASRWNLLGWESMRAMTVRRCFENMGLHIRSRGRICRST